MAKKQSVGDEIYSGTAEFGKIVAIISFVISIISALVLIPLGIYFIVRKTKLTKSATGTIENITSIGDHRDLQVQFTDLNNKKRTVTISDYSTNPYQTGQNIQIFYDPNNPQNANSTNDDSHVLGIIFIVIGIILPLLSGLWLYFTRKSKVAAAAGGVFAGLDLLSGGNIGGFF
tara:strand:- start:772 stop:1293 length:522 start_codon:yes stop_codon:yes gene_type:complete